MHDPAHNPGPRRHPGRRPDALEGRRLRRRNQLEAWGKSLIGAMEALQVLAAQRVAEMEEDQGEAS